MINLPKDVAERLYSIYAATLMNPVPFEEMVLTDQHLWAYSNGKRKPEEQLLWIHKLHRRNADMDEPYDVGVLNALEIVKAILDHDVEKVPEFVDKPEVAEVAEIEDLQPEVDALKANVKGLMTNIRDSKKSFAAKAAKAKEAHGTEVKNLKEAVEKYKKELVLAKVDLKNCKSALKTASVTV